MEDIYNLNKFEITQVIEKQNFPKYRSEQIWRYLYKNEVESFDEMKNISTKLIDLLKQNYVRSEEHTSELQSQD